MLVYANILWNQGKRRKKNMLLLRRIAVCSWFVNIFCFINTDAHNGHKTLYVSSFVLVFSSLFGSNFVLFCSENFFSSKKCRTFHYIVWKRHRIFLSNQNNSQNNEKENSMDFIVEINLAKYKHLIVAKHWNRLTVDSSSDN